MLSSLKNPSQNKGALTEPKVHHLTAETVRRLLRYEASTGRLFWLHRPRELCVSEQYYNAWNTRNADKEAFTTCGGSGYHTGAIFGKRYQAHRVVWALMTGAWPIALIDHINGDRSDNRFENLQVVSEAENARNQRRRSDNTSGITGVFFNTQKRKWQAQITLNGRNHRLGFFANIDEAALARKAASIRLGFSARHGEA